VRKYGFQKCVKEKKSHENLKALLYGSDCLYSRCFNMSVFMFLVGLFAGLWIFDKGSTNMNRDKKEEGLKLK